MVTTDLHLHSKYSRAVSPKMILPLMAETAKQKGLDIISMPDWTHPRWIEEVKLQLIQKEEGLYQLKGQYSETYFLLSTEISCIYKQHGKLRRIHNLVLVPTIEAAEKILKKLIARGANLSADGRPIIGLSAKELLETALTADARSLLIPSHIWTPHFGMYGSASGFDSIEECFEDLSSYIYGIETGLSSDPSMNWRIKELENRSILSFSDAHSLHKIGREVTVMQLASLSFQSISDAVRRHDTEKNAIAYTIEFYPEEGKYHYSGHRNCNVVMSPGEIVTDGNTCSICHKKLTEGVLNRVHKLSSFPIGDVLHHKKIADGMQWFTDKTKHHPPYIKLVPLLEIIANAEKSTAMSQKVRRIYASLCASLGSELHILQNEAIEKIASIGGERIALFVGKVRKGEIAISPGYDGIYGKVSI